MNIDSVSSTVVSTTTISASSAVGANAPSGPASVDRDGDHDGGRLRGGFGSFMGSIIQALGQIGVGQTAQAASSAQPVSSTPPSSGTQSSDSSGSAASTQNPLQALEAFLQSLFQALGSESGGAQGASAATGTGTNTSGAPPVQGEHHHHHGGLVAKLQTLLQDVSGGSSSPGTSGSSSGSGAGQSGTSDLNGAFQNLVGAFGGSSSGSGAPTLQEFLQNLIQDLQHRGGGSTAAVGGVVSASA